MTATSNHKSGNEENTFRGMETELGQTPVKIPLSMWKLREYLSRYGDCPELSRTRRLVPVGGIEENTFRGMETFVTAAD